MKFSTAWHVGGGAVRKGQANILNALPFMLTVHLLPIQTNSFWLCSHTPSIPSIKKRRKTSVIICCYKRMISFNLSGFVDLSMSS